MINVESLHNTHFQDFWQRKNHNTQLLIANIFGAIQVVEDIRIPVLSIGRPQETDYVKDELLKSIFEQEPELYEEIDFYCKKNEIYFKKKKVTVHFYYSENAEGLILRLRGIWRITNFFIDREFYFQNSKAFDYIANIHNVGIVI